MKSSSSLFASWVAAATLASSTVGAESLQTTLQLDTTIASLGGELWRQFPPTNTPIPLSSEKPDWVKVEPQYEGTPRYGRFRLGNGPRSEFGVIVVDEPPGQANLRRLFIDANHDGDFTNDGEGKWKTLSRRPDEAVVSGYPTVLRASWGDASRETSSGDYAVMFVYFPERDGSWVLSYRGTTARVGELMLGEVKARVVALESDNDALFVTPASQPLHLWIDADNDGLFNWNERFDAREPFSLAGRTYEAEFTADGAELTLTPSTRPAQVLKERRIQRPGRIELLAVGKEAPDFIAIKPDGGEMRFSELRGQVVILDFWAPWCGPCKASMPALDQLYQEVRDQGVTVLGLCVWDTRAAFDKWIASPQVKTTYPLAFDPAGRDTANNNADSIASKLYNVTGIPTFYIVDRDGKVAGAFVGNSPQTKQSLRDTLQRLGVKL